MAPHVVIVGGGFGGLNAAKRLRRVPVRVTVLDRWNHHLFQPLLYQVAMAGLNPSEIAVPIRSVLRRAPGTQVLLAEVVGLDLAARRVLVLDGEPVSYDYLILAAGAENNYYGHQDWAPHAPGLKSLDDALEIRRRVLIAFEAAEREREETRRARLLTFVVVGAGPTGVELAGAIAELGRHVLAKDFRSIDPRSTRVILLEGGPRVLAPFDPRLSESAAGQLAGLGVEVRTGARVTAIDETGVRLGDDLIPAATVLWAAGVRPSPLAAMVGTPLDRMGRLVVEQDCSIPGHPEVFAIGDIASFTPPGGTPLPGLSPVAIQQGRAVARNIRRSIEGEPRQPFVYLDKGMMATIGRSRAVAQMRSLRLRGLPAWLAWLFVHLWYLIGFRNRVFVMLQWGWAYLRYKHGARLITGGRLAPGPPPSSP